MSSYDQYQHFTFDRPGEGRNRKSSAGLPVSAVPRR